MCTEMANVLGTIFVQLRLNVGISIGYPIISSLLRLMTDVSDVEVVSCRLVML